MGVNAKNFAICKITKKEKEWRQTLSAGYLTLWSNICPIVTVKSLDSSLNSEVQVELDSQADTSVAGSNVLVVHDHECYVNAFGKDSKSRHKNVTPVYTAVV